MLSHRIWNIVASWMLAYLITFSLICDPAAAQSKKPKYDVLIRNGTVYDGSGSAGIRADVAISGDKICSHSEGKLEVW